MWQWKKGKSPGIQREIPLKKIFPPVPPIMQEFEEKLNNKSVE